MKYSYRLKLYSRFVFEVKSYTKLTKVLVNNCIQVYLQELLCASGTSKNAGARLAYTFIMIGQGAYPTATSSKIDSSKFIEVFDLLVTAHSNYAPYNHGDFVVDIVLI